MNRPTRARSSAAMRVRSPADLRVSLAPADVSWAALATPVMFSAISPLPLAASDTLRLISFVVAVCSSTAVAMVFWMSLICPMIELIWPMAARRRAPPRWSR